MIDKLIIRTDNILVDPIDPTETTDSGLVMDSQYEDKSYSGKVLSVGPDVKEIKKGMTVYFNKYSSSTFPFKTKEYEILREEDILAYKK